MGRLIVIEGACDRKAIFGLFGRPVMKSKRSIHRKIYGLVKKMDN